MEGLTRNPYLRQATANLATYVDVFVKTFLGLAQGPVQWRHQVRLTLFHFLEKVFQTYESGNLANRKEVLSMKKIRSGEFTWST